MDVFTLLWSHFSPAPFLQLCVVFSKRCILIQSPFQGLCIQPDSSFQKSCVCSCCFPSQNVLYLLILEPSYLQGSLAGSLTHWPGVKGKIWAHQSWPTMLQASGSDSFSSGQGDSESYPRPGNEEASFVLFIQVIKGDLRELNARPFCVLPCLLLKY